MNSCGITMENAWRYRTPSVKLEPQTVQMAPPYYDNGTNSGHVDFSSSHNINRAMGAANNVIYQQSSWIPMQTVADFQMSVARISHIMRDGPRLPGYSLQSNIHYANYNAVPATQPSYQQSRWSAQPLQGHYPMVATNSLHVATEDSVFSAVPQSYYAPCSSMPTPQLSQAQSSNWAPQTVVTEFPFDAVSRPQIKVENSGFSEFSHQPDEINHAPYSEAAETLSSYEQSSNWAPQSVETNFPVATASTPHIKVENSGLSEFSHGTNDSHTPYTEVPEASLSNEQSSNWAPQSEETNFPVGTASTTHIKVENSGLSEFSHGPNESHTPYNEVREASSSNEQTSWMPPQAGFPTDTGSSADIKTEDPGHSECSYQSGERTVESRPTVPTIQSSNEKDYPEGLVSNDFTLTGADCTWLPDDNYSSRSQDENLPDYFVASQASNEEIQNNGRQLQNWFCPTCYETFSSSDSLSTHQERVHSSGVRWYKCQNCSETFTTPQNLKTHVVNEHTNAGERPFACAMCSKTFKRTGNLKDHVNIHSKEKKLSCKVCKQAFLSRAARSRHTKSHNQEKQDTAVDFKFECEHCQFRFPTKSKLTEHMRSHRPRRHLPCKVCGMEFETKEDLKSHSSSVHSSDASLSCSTCNRNFSCKQSLKIHIQSIHDNKDRPFKCTLCDKAFNRKDIMEEHVNLHTKEKVYSCIICQHSCYSRGAHRMHMQYHTLDDESTVNDKNVTCKHCSKIFPDKAALKKHMRSHSKKRELSCAVCFLTFRTEASLQLHHAVHVDSKPKQTSEKSSQEHSEPEKLSSVPSSDASLSCSTCDRNFSCKQSLKIHIQSIHDNKDRPFKCTVCDKAFNRKDIMEEHVNLHTKEKVYSCIICQHFCYSRGAHRMHMKSHNLDDNSAVNDKNVGCKHCPKQFSNQSALKEHMRSHANDGELSCKDHSSTFKTVESLQVHNAIHANSKPEQSSEKSSPEHSEPERLLSVLSSDASLSCSTCNRNFSCKQSLKKHVKSIHDNKDRPFKCTLCDKSFKRRDVLKEHVNIHTKEKVYSCVICQHFCYSRGAHRMHMLSHTLDDESAVNDENVTCENCLKQFSDKSALKEHICSQSEKRELSCEVCFLTFETLASLQLHHAVPADSKPGDSSEKSSPEHSQSEKLSFGTCSKVYFSRQAFKRHTRLSHDVTTQRLPCTMCDKTFKCRASLKEHTNTHTENKGYPCDMCESASSTRFGLHRHKETHSIEELEAAAEKEILQRYKQSHIEGKPINIFTCLICKEKFQSSQCIEEHLQRHVLETLFDCSICPATFKSRYSLSKHKIAHFNGKPFECSNCGKAFRKKSHMKEHQLIHTRVRKFNCTQCPATFQDFADLRKHRETHPKPQEVKKHECKICHQKFLRPNILRIHAYKHTKAKPFSCSICSKKFIGKYSCQQHELTHRMERNHKCPICGVAFHYPGRLKIHMKNSHSDSHDLKLFACDLCDKRYGHSGTLTAHRKTHFDQELYSCSLCDRSNLSKRGLRNHQRSHAANQRIYPCDKCDKKFKTRHNLANHLASAIHSNVRPFLCQVCGKTFTHLGRLRRHALAHSQNKSFICEVCGKTCSRRDNLRTHMKVHNPSRQKKVEGI
ncbi:zinc finger protein 208-like isoform X2 [Patiria miniata]|uniref:C2H2-type domain-containing protein n=1 Tax=Patiria miniata TaxID=46514 RepID=A0A914A6M7_PATMI|nr:zinc finger protein 208-like isoform X2 [Patiria miniata]